MEIHISVHNQLGSLHFTLMQFSSILSTSRWDNCSQSFRHSITDLIESVCRHTQIRCIMIHVCTVPISGRKTHKARIFRGDGQQRSELSASSDARDHTEQSAKFFLHAIQWPRYSILVKCNRSKNREYPLFELAWWIEDNGNSHFCA